MMSITGDKYRLRINQSHESERQSAGVLNGAGSPRTTERSSGARQPDWVGWHNTSI
jgi:hypothetical protein